MSADVLRRAAALMRERADAATPGPWEPRGDAEDEWAVAQAPHPSESVWVARMDGVQVDAEHIASWHPAVALAAADSLMSHAVDHEHNLCPNRVRACPTVVFARAYLGEPS